MKMFSSKFSTIYCYTMRYHHICNQTYLKSQSNPVTTDQKVSGLNPDGVTKTTVTAVMVVFLCPCCNILPLLLHECYTTDNPSKIIV
jgi:hypothetical protein